MVAHGGASSAIARFGGLGEDGPGCDLGELDFRYNTRKIEDGERTKLAIRTAEGKRLRPVQGSVVYCR